MAEFVLWTRIEGTRAGTFVARVTALPRGVKQRCAPEERSERCSRREEACEAAQKLARALAHDIRARGNRVVVPARAPATAIPS